MKAIETRGLTKRYGKMTAVDRLDLNIEEGKLYALLGVNGAGKTTAIRMLCGITQPDAGEAALLGHNVCREKEAVRRIIGVSPQESAVAPKLSVRENLEFIGEIHGMSRREARDRARQLMREFQLEEIAGRRAGVLSGGWQRRLSIAMALVNRPRILFLDEPTLGLDVLARRSMWKLVEEFKGSITILLTTHYMEEAQELSDCVGILRGGHLVAEGSVGELMMRANAKSFEEAFVALAAPGEVCG